MQKLGNAFLYFLVSADGSRSQLGNAELVAANKRVGYSNVHSLDALCIINSAANRLIGEVVQSRGGLLLVERGYYRFHI